MVKLIPNHFKLSKIVFDGMLVMKVYLTDRHSLEHINKNELRL